MADQINTTTGERWRPVVGWEGLYEVSDHGRVRSLERVLRIASSRQQPHGYQRVLRGRLLKPVDPGTGYMRVNLNAVAKRDPVLAFVHRLVLEAFVGPCPKGFEAAHDDGVRANNRLDNLRWATRLSNHADKQRHGTTACGEKIGASKLRADQVKAIKRAASGRNGSALAREYGVNPSTVNRIVKGERWRHV